jgi:hypothetical protein
VGTGIRDMVANFGRLAQKAGPYVLLEIVLPGGTLFALLLYLHRTGQLRELLDARLMARAMVRGAARAFDQLAYGFQPCDPLAASPHPELMRDQLNPLDLRSVAGRARSRADARSFGLQEARSLAH